MSETTQLPNDETNGKKDRRYAFNLILAGLIGQVGCLTLGIIFAALILGLWLDNLLDSKPILTILLLVGSVPLTVIAMLFVVRKAAAKIKINTTQSENSLQEEADRGTSS